MGLLDNEIGIFWLIWVLVGIFLQLWFSVKKFFIHGFEVVIKLSKEIFLVFEDGIFLDGLDVLDLKDFVLDFILLDKWEKLMLLSFVDGVVLELVDLVEVLLMGGS